MNLKTFDECIEISTNAKKRHLVLGNGFSIACRNNIFSYKYLYDGIKSEKLRKMFDDFGTKDYEFVMRKLSEACYVLQTIFTDTEKLKKEIQEIQNYIEELKQTLIEVISKHHPNTCNDLSIEEYNSCYKFLKIFDDGRKYTFNYDLILYWFLMRFKNSTDKKLKVTDGFGLSENECIEYKCPNDYQQSLYYIHGAMHIFNDVIKSNKSPIVKYDWMSKGIPLAEQVRNAIYSDRYPMFISEGSTEHKYNRILNNGYLARVINSIKNIKDDIFFFGYSLRDDDDHFLTPVFNNSDIKNIFISLYGNINSDYNQIIIMKVNNWQEKTKNILSRNYYFYDAQSAKVWNNF